MSLADRLTRILSELPPHVTLVAVSKTKPVELMREAYEAGQRDFGENYVQELCDKQPQLPNDIRWHFIGHLQSNKVKYIAPFVHVIHSVDSLKLLKEIDRQAGKAGRKIDCLLQVYIAREETKFGLDFQECEALLASSELKALHHINVTGLMGMASNTADEEQVQQEFRSLHTFFEQVRVPHHLSALSMGMSSDYKLAIAQGSTMIRVGSSLFGERQYGAPQGTSH
jgi:PLP dependent protein